MSLIEFIEKHKTEYLEELKEFLRIPSISTRQENKADIERAAGWLVEKLPSAGMQRVELIATATHPSCTRSQPNSLAERPSFSTGTMTCSRLNRSGCGPFLRSNLPFGAAIFTVAVAPMTKGRCTFT